MITPRSVSWVVAGTLLAAYSTLSVHRHRRMESTGYDLGIFEQGVRGYAHFRAPVAELKGPGFNLLGDHFHPVIAVIGPLYRLFPSPVTLLVVQSALLALSAVPVTRLWADRHGVRAGTCVGLGYGLAWGLQRAAVFDFHEIAFAVPLVARCVVLLAEGRDRAAAAWAVPLLLVKEDQALIVAAVGVLLFRRGERKVGAFLVLLAVTVAAAVTLVVIPAFNPDDSYKYFGVTEPDSDNPLLRLVTPVATKGLTVLALLAPTLFLGLRSPLALLLVPTLLARFWTSNPFLWGTGFHYSAVLMPIVFVAALDGLRRVRESGLPDRLAHGITKVAPIAIVTAALVPTLIGAQPLSRLMDPSYGRVPSRVGAAKAILAVIPDGADVAASNHVAPQLTGRCRVFKLAPAALALRPEWAVSEDPGPAVAGSGEGMTAPGLAGWGYRPVARGGGITLHRLRV
ncbi:DUF2079 domain-containing protein [Actinomadura pelletieri]|nr:DUF2079 domain-containing protein [Actinomadura pelletieri]